ncbi:hypothetical protein PCANB_002605 [Pneumocystis canis]|nr:hypothetical protein PCK1_002774 [Pneumocystis canis]KAG5438501.1 hypothetical protein PCANB_002605 [Pneumocystis canis]
MLNWWTSRAFDELVEKATSENMPAGTEDLTCCLEICDTIRSKSVSSKDAMRSLKRRISHQNPDVQVSVLKLIDLCVKNGGDHFLLEISSREFMDHLVLLLKENEILSQNDTTRTEIHEKILGLIQTWAVLFEKKENLGYVSTIYKDLLSQGYNFPPKEILSTTYIDSFTPPDWSDSNTCMLCRTKFTFKNRKHHCRNCGGVFCHPCSSKSLSLLYMGIIEPVRVCNSCYSKKTQDSAISMPDNVLKVGHSESINMDDNDNDNLKYAIKLSLEENKLQKSNLESQENFYSNDYKDEYSDDDKDLKEAISLSLKEMKLSESNNINVQIKKTIPDDQFKFEHELTTSEVDNINTFFVLVKKLQTAPLGSILRDHRVQELHDSVVKLKPKLIRSLGNTISKYEKLIDIHSKLLTVMKYYDKLLEDRLSITYSEHTLFPVHKTESLHANQQECHSSLLVPVDSQFLSSEYYSCYKNTQLQKDQSYYTENIPQESNFSKIITNSGRFYSHEESQKPFSKEVNLIASSSKENHLSNPPLHGAYNQSDSFVSVKDSYAHVYNQHNPIYNISAQSFDQQTQNKNDYSEQISLIDL